MGGDGRAQIKVDDPDQCEELPSSLLLVANGDVMGMGQAPDG
jgi:hypothetical protein